MSNHPTSPTPKPTRRDPYRLVGETFDGRYRLEEFAGMGSFGAVYRALSTRVGRTVAVKILKPDLADDEAAGARELFQREALTAGRLSHPHIVAVTDVGEHEGFAYMVMEWLDGRTLEQEMRGRVPFTPEETAALLTQIADALQYAHEAGVIHRDIKPSNIHLGLKERPFVKMLDFGIAKVITSSTAVAASRIAGTVSYMSPEQVLGSAINHRSDIYSLGIVLYQMLTGTLPFVGDSQGHIIQQHIAAPPPLLTNARPDLPYELSSVIQRALAKNPEDRHRSARDLSQEFSAALRASSQPTEVYRPPEDKGAHQRPTLPPTRVVTDQRDSIPLHQPEPPPDQRYYPSPPTQGAPYYPYAPHGRNDLPPTEVVPTPNWARQSPQQHSYQVPYTGPHAGQAIPLSQQIPGAQGHGRRSMLLFALGGAFLFFLLTFLYARPYYSSSDYYSIYYYYSSRIYFYRRFAFPIFGAMLGIVVSAFRQPGVWSIRPDKRIRSFLAHGAAAGAALMVIYLFGDSEFSLILAFFGFLLGLAVCGVRLIIQKSKSRSSR